MNFVLQQMTFLRYFIPLIVDGNKRGIKSKVFFGSINKYNNPLRYIPQLMSYSEKYDFEIYPLTHINDYKSDITFLVENHGLDSVKYKTKKIVLTSMSDFRVLYNQYIDEVDKVVFPSKKFAEYYNTISDKNMYIGSPKYDIELNKSEILEKYQLNNKPKAFIFHPKTRDRHMINMSEYVDALREMGYEVLTKTRGKDTEYNHKQIGDKYFEDVSWFPHTSMELIYISDIVINTGSSGIKEVLMLNKPVINFDIKPDDIGLLMPFLYNYPFVKNYKSLVSKEQFKIDVKELAQNKYDYSDVINDCLFDSNDISKKILDEVL